MLGYWNLIFWRGCIQWSKWGGGQKEKGSQLFGRRCAFRTDALHYDTWIKFMWRLNKRDDDLVLADAAVSTESSLQGTTRLRLGLLAKDHSRLASPDQSLVFAARVADVAKTLVECSKPNHLYILLNTRLIGVRWPALACVNNVIFISHRCYCRVWPVWSRT